MTTQTVMMPNNFSLSSQTARLFVETANKFKSSVWLKYMSYQVNAKSLLGILAIKVVGGVKIEVTADGKDEESAVKELCNFLQNKDCMENTAEVVK